MMKEWKIRQDVYHRTHEITDAAFDIIEQDLDDESLIEDIIRYMTAPESRLLYPTKAYAVAIVYATLLAEYFDENFIEALSDPDLLYGNDKYFVPYMEAPHIYNRVIGQISVELCFDNPQISATKDYFLKEFLIDA